MNNRILITGGCGFIGTNLIALLRETGGPEIRVLDNESLGKREYLDGFEVEFQHGDLRDPEAVARAVEQVDCVVHLAADTRVMDSISKPEYNFQVNLIGTMNLLLAMRRVGVGRMVNASTGGAILGEVPPPVHEDMLPAPQSPYGASKLAIEGYLAAFSGSYGMQACSLRFSNVYGPRSFHKGSVVAAFFRNILAGRELVIYGDGSQNRDYVYVRDLCLGIRAAIERGVSGVYQLGTGLPTSLNELVERMRGVVGDGHTVRVRYEDFRAGELRHTWCNIAKARLELGYDPATKLSDGLRKTWNWFCLQA